jgi:hypothetical protein
MYAFTDQNPRINNSGSYDKPFARMFRFKTKICVFVKIMQFGGGFKCFGGPDSGL